MACLFVSVQTSTYAQAVAVGVSKELHYEFHGELPHLWVIGVHAGHSWEHLALFAKYTNTLNVNKTHEINELGLEARWFFWKRTSWINGFLDASWLTQIQANRGGTILIHDPLAGHHKYFYKSHLTQSYQLGLNLYYQHFMFYGAVGYGQRIWSSYYSLKTPSAEYYEKIWGPRLSFGANIYIDYKRKKE